MDIWFVGLGLLALVAGGGALVSGAVALAQRWGLSPLVIGVTLVGMGTSLPELLTSLRAAMSGAPGLAMGNVVGSNTANVLLILGIAAVLRPISVDRATWRSDGLVLLAVSVVGAVVIAFSAGVDRTGAIVFLLGFAAWLIWQLRTGRVETAEEKCGLSLTRAVVFLLLGFIGVLAGAESLVRGATGLARGMGVSEAVIGLTIVAVGTSLPELATSAIAAWKGRGDVALGNVLGSNIFNLLGILGVTGLVAPMAIGPRFAQIDLPVMVGAVVLFLVLALRGSLGRIGGSVLLTGYGLYLMTTLA
ncbi:cation:H+ antiporter [Jannaschia faecimaris]|uniref:Cation:H+ antiporter n=1 Tax=Jannaschia faecimaris TaxID=1244108 RepID=A0A1H3LC97_9RHOB|nr:calcium/sodium antiporter [Jannaschia faecimaris]SDY61799.1 cation:H+ antiporter [Jannaschia faecimaris]